MSRPDRCPRRRCRPGNNRGAPPTEPCRYFAPALVGFFATAALTAAPVTFLFLSAFGFLASLLLRFCPLATARLPWHVPGRQQPA